MTDISVAARELLGAGFALCRIRAGEKLPGDGGWPLNPISDPAAFHPGDGVGVIAGSLSGGLVTVDLDLGADDADAWAAADEILPPTPCMDGRSGTLTAHRHYRLTDTAWTDDYLPLSGLVRTAMDDGRLPRFCGIRHFSDGAGRCLDFIGAGGQCVVPPSPHHSGVNREWFAGCLVEPASIDFATLFAAVERLAARLGMHGRKPAAPAPPVDRAMLDRVPSDRRARRLQEYLRAAPAHRHCAGEGYHAQQYRICMTACEFGVEYADALPLVVAWDSTSATPDGDRVMSDTLLRAYERGSFGSMITERTKSAEPATSASGSALPSPGVDREQRRGRMVILPSVGPNDETITVPMAATSIFGVLKHHGIYMRGGVIHELCDDGDGPALVPMGPHDFIARVPRTCDLLAWRCPKDEPVLKPVPKMSVDCAQAILAAREASDVLPPVASVMRCPGLAERDGRLVSMVSGYNPECGGVIITGRTVIPDISASEAWSLLVDLVQDFDFVTPSDRSRCLAGFITPALRLAGLIPGHIPIDIVEADKSQTGKGFREALRCKIYGEDANVVSQKKGGVGSMDESISQKLIDGRPFIQLDNVRGRIESAMLEAILTPNGIFAARIPRCPEVRVDPRRFIFSMTSNAAELTRDLANRACVIRIRKRPPRHAFKVYTLSTGRTSDVLGWVTDQQPRLLGAVHAICREWFAAGRPSNDERRHSFRQWAGILDWIVQRHGEAPLLDGHEAIVDRVGDSGLAWLRSVALLVGQKAAQSWSASRLAEIASEHGLSIPNCRVDADERGQAKAVGVIMRRLLLEADSIEVDGVTVARRQVRDPEGRERHEYAFSPDSPNPRTPEGQEQIEKRGCFSNYTDPSGVPGLRENRMFSESGESSGCDGEPVSAAPARLTENGQRFDALLRLDREDRKARGLP